MQAVRILDLLAGMHLILHISPHRFPKPHRQRQAGLWQFEEVLLPCLGIDKAEPQAILALHAILGRALGLCHPGRYAFPGHDDRRLTVTRCKGYLAALTVEAGGDVIAELEVILTLDDKSHNQD
ncbi:hypothetical protein A8U91_00336 [Halomonas elongata]|uniref:Uncharacterized protein n=1 Tax=Halomonas elongata TaxID=2746 RepID=A0A1B8P187_HALEL|nr:hypothetical protein [Halomonas elongata]OBX36000.1 hypothetical protein A8U91_00336 [Halomonas elongata]